MPEKMCQACWVVPAKKKLRGADGIYRWRCNSCAAKLAPQRAATEREKLVRKIFNKDNV